MKATLLFFLAINLYSFQSNAMDKAVHGEDNRKEMYEVNNQIHLDIADSSAAMIKKTKFHANPNDKHSFLVKSKTLFENAVCATESFTDQISAAECSGFLIGPNLLVTAGHCVIDQADCDKFNWVFDYEIEKQSLYEFGSGKIIISKKNVYACKEILERKYDRKKGDDFAVISLERSVDDRLPLSYRRAGKVDKSAVLAMVGYPSGVPKKVTDSGIIRTNKKPNFFMTDLDSFSGNSGSPVFNSDTGIVEGIMVRGNDDYKFSRRLNCSTTRYYRRNRFKNYGSDVMRITEIEMLKDKK